MSPKLSTSPSLCIASRPDIFPLSTNKLDCICGSSITFNKASFLVNADNV